MWARRGRRKEAEPLPAVRALHLSREDLPERPRSHQVTAAEVVECSRFEAGLRISGAAIALFDSSEFSGNGSSDCGDGPFAPADSPSASRARLRSRAEDHVGGTSPNPADPANSALMTPAKSSRGRSMNLAM